MKTYASSKLMPDCLDLAIIIYSNQFACQVALLYYLQSYVMRKPINLISNLQAMADMKKPAETISENMTTGQ